MIQTILTHWAAMSVGVLFGLFWAGCFRPPHVPINGLLAERLQHSLDDACEFGEATASVWIEDLDAAIRAVSAACAADAGQVPGMNNKKDPTP